MEYDLDNRIIKVDVANDDVKYCYDALGRAFYSLVFDLRVILNYSDVICILNAVSCMTTLQKIEQISLLEKYVVVARDIDDVR